MTALESIEHAMVPFVLVLTRTSGLAMGLPHVLVEMAPVSIRVATALMLAVILTLGQSSYVLFESVVPAFLGEFFLGVFLGLGVRLALAAAELAAEIAGQQLGFGFGSTVDPMSQEPAGPLTRLVSATSGLMLFVLDGHRAIIRGLSATLEIIPAGSARFSVRWSQELVDAVPHLFRAALLIGAPIIIASFATQISFGLLTRVAPQLNLWGIGFLVTVAVGLFCLVLFAPTLLAEIENVLRHGLARFAEQVGIG